MFETSLESLHRGYDLCFAEVDEVLDPSTKLIEIANCNLGPDDEVVLVLDIAKYLFQRFLVDLPVALFRRPPDYVRTYLFGSGDLARECYFKLLGLRLDLLGLLEKNLCLRAFFTHRPSPPR